MNYLNMNVGVLFFALFYASCTSKSNPTPQEPVSSDPKIGCTDPLAKNYKTTATEEDCSCQYEYKSVISSTIPNTFQQKVLIEQHTGTWCGWCPMGKEAMKIATQNTNVVGVEIHYNDEMANMDKFYNPLKNKFGHPAFPSGMVNRKKSIVGSTIIMGADKHLINDVKTTDWQVNVDAILKVPKTPFGLALETKLTGRELELMAHVSFQISMSDKYGLGIYLVENEVTGYPQMNYLSNYSMFKDYEAYSLPSEIANIKHFNVSRDAIAPIDNGIDIPFATSNYTKIYHKYFKTTLPQIVTNTEKCKVIAFIVNRKTNEIINVQEVAMNKASGW